MKSTYVECSDNIKENIYNKEVILFKIENQILCFSVDYINYLINDKPFYVKQIGNDDEKLLFDDVNTKKPKRSFLLRQSNPIQQIIIINSNVAVDYEFISAFQSGRNTFELINPSVVWLFKDSKNYSININLYKSKTIERSKLLSNHEINEEMKIKPQNDYTRYKVSEIEEEKDKGKCVNKNYFDGNEIIFNDDLIMIFFKDRPSAVYCYSFNELVKLIEYRIDHNKKRELKNGVVVIKDYYTGVWFDVGVLEILLSEKVNTIVLVPKEDYYEPVKSSRKELFPNDDFSSNFSDSLKFKNTEYHDEGDIRYRKRYAYYEDDGPVYSVEWLRYNKNNPRDYRIADYKNEPGYTRYNENGDKIEEKFYYNDNIIKNIKYVNGQIDFEKWTKNGVLHRDETDEKGNDLPAIILYYNNNTKKEETWYLNGELGRKQNLPVEITYYINGNKLSEKWYIDSGTGHLILYHENGKKNLERWYKNSKFNREGDEPAYIKYYKNGNKEEERWYKNDKFHHEGDEPAWIDYYENGNKKEERWYKNDKLRRDTQDKIGQLPTIVSYYENGKKKEEAWYKNGMFYFNILRDENGNIIE